MNGKLIVVATIVAKEGKSDLVRQALLDLIPITEKEPGYIQYDLHESLDRPGAFVFYEVWEDERSLRLHAGTASMKAHNEKTGPWIQSVSVEKFRRID